MELEIAGLADRPAVDLPVPEKIERLRRRQEALKNPDRTLLKVGAKELRESVHYDGDIIIRWSTTEPRPRSIDVGQVCNTSPGSKASVKWWALGLPCPLKKFALNIAEGVLVLLEDLT